MRFLASFLDSTGSGIFIYPLPYGARKRAVYRVGHGDL